MNLGCALCTTGSRILRCDEGPSNRGNPSLTASKNLTVSRSRHWKRTVTAAERRLGATLRPIPTSCPAIWFIHAAGRAAPPRGRLAPARGLDRQTGGLRRAPRDPAVTLRQFRGYIRMDPENLSKKLPRAAEILRCRRPKKFERNPASHHIEGLIDCAGWTNSPTGRLRRRAMGN